MDSHLTLTDPIEDDSSDEEESFRKHNKSIVDLSADEDSEDGDSSVRRIPISELKGGLVRRPNTSKEHNNSEVKVGTVAKDTNADLPHIIPCEFHDCKARWSCPVNKTHLLYMVITVCSGSLCIIARPDIIGLSWQRAGPQTTERCATGWIPHNVTGLKKTLERKLHGQHIAKTVVLRTLRGHLRNPDPKKALVLSLHGQVGIGKSFVSNLIIEQLYYKGTSSSFVHKKVGSFDFPQKDEVAEYKEKLKTLVQNAVKDCPRSLFVFEEVHEFPDGLLDVLSPYLDYNAVIDEVDYRKAIFILTSNTGHNAISKFAVEQWEKKAARESITHTDLNDLLTKAVFNENDGLQGSLIGLRHQMVSALVGFLPLEKHHVELCARDDAIGKGLHFTKDALKKVAEEMTYYPDDKEIFSKYGCI